MGIILHSRASSVAIIELIANDMRSKMKELILNGSSKISLILDESTSLSKKSCLIVYLRCNFGSSQQNVFMDLIELEDEGAQTIFNAVMKCLKEIGFTEDFLRRNLVSVVTDGASVMLGSRTGVCKRFQDVFPQIIVWHCLNHRIELAINDTCRDISAIFHLKSFVDKLYSLYSQSPKLVRNLEQIANDLEIQLRKIGRILDTRWVASSYRTVSAILNNYKALHAHFKAMSQSRTEKNKAQYSGLVRRMESVSFVQDLTLFSDCLGQISILSQHLEDAKCDIISADRNLQWTINALCRIKENVQNGFYNFDHLFPSGKTEFKGVQLEREGMHGKHYQSLPHLQFIQSLIDNISSRCFMEKSLLEELEVIIPDRWPSTVSAPWFEGERKLLDICKRFNVDQKNIIPEYRRFVENPLRIPDIIRDRVLNNILKIIPISSSECERGFSQMNNICTEQRSCITVSHMSACLCISLNGPPPHLWNCDTSVTAWLKYHRSATDNQSKKCKIETVDDLNEKQKIFC